MPYKDKEKRRLWHKKRRKEIRRFINSFKKECKICGYNKCKAALEFHHPKKDKKFRICDLKTFSNKRIQEEIEKCIVVCANCHREIHHPEKPEDSRFKS